MPQSVIWVTNRVTIANRQWAVESASGQSRLDAQRRWQSPPGVRCPATVEQESVLRS